jgi:uncharacterized membrane protein
MANKQRNASVKTRSGNELTVQENETDSPIIPVQHLEKLHSFRPDLVDWVVNQTEKEAEHRRSHGKRIDFYIYTERLLGQIFGFSIGLAGIGGGAYVAIQGQPWAGVSIATAAITGLATAFIVGRNKSKSN